MKKKSVIQRHLGKGSAFRNSDGRYDAIPKKEGRSVTHESDPAKGGGSFKYAESVAVTSRPKPASKPTSARTTEPNLARPVQQRVDPCEFAAELLVTDRIIMDLLAK